MTISLELAAEVRRLFFAEHWKRGTIVAQLGVHADVVARVLGPFGPRPGTRRPEARVLEPYHSFIDETLARYPRLVSTRLCDMLRDRGYKGSINVLRRYVLQTRPKPKHEVFIRVDTLSGEQAQVDWAHVGEMIVPGGKRPLWAFVMVLAYSRASFAELVFSLDAHSLSRSLIRASAHFGGSPRQWLFDNAKAVVVDRHGDLVRFHPKLVDLAAEMHVQPRLCGPRKPHEKGRVERAIRFFKERFFAARSFHSIEHGNVQLLSFIRDIADARPHPRFPERSVADVFAEERERLLALPSPLPSTEQVEPVAIDKTAFLKLDTNLYSVPAEYARRSLVLAADDRTIRLLDGHREVARHERCWGRAQRVEDPEHRRALLEQKRAAREPKGRDRLRAELPGIDVIFERWLDHGRNLGSMVARTLSLLDAYGAALLGEVVTEMVARGTHDTGAMARLCETRRRRGTSGGALPLELGSHVLERDVVPHDLGGYDE